MLGTEEPKMPETLAFLYECSRDFPKKTLKEDWVTYGVKIDAKGEAVGPLDLLLKVNGSGLSGEHKVDKDFHWQEPFYRLLMAYRMKKVRESLDTNYASGMISKLYALGRCSVWKITTTGVLDTTKFDGVLDDPNVKKVIAAIDMFLTKFEDHEWGFLRAGTLLSRYKQCMGLLDLFYADTAFYLLKGEILRWMFIDQVADQVTWIYEEPDEIGVMSSYMPYCVDLELVGKSPYSATANDALHNWVHILGSLSGLERSKSCCGESRSIPGACCGNCSLRDGEVYSSETDVPEGGRDSYG
jgi:hypothetical protein